MTIRHAIIHFAKHIRGHFGSLTISLPSHQCKDNGQGRDRSHRDASNLDHLTQITLGRAWVTAPKRAQTCTPTNAIHIFTTVGIRSVVTVRVGCTADDGVGGTDSRWHPHTHHLCCVLGVDGTKTPLTDVGRCTILEVTTQRWERAACGCGAGDQGWLRRKSSRCDRPCRVLGGYNNRVRCWVGCLSAFGGWCWLGGGGRRLLCCSFMFSGGLIPGGCMDTSSQDHERA